MKRRNVLRDAQAAPAKEGLEAHRQSILVLRDKGYTWREIAAFLNERGVAADHTAVYRLIKGRGAVTQDMKIPSAEEYVKALSDIEINDNQRSMLLAHYRHHNRSISYRELGQAVGYDVDTSKLWYGRLGFALGEKLNFTFYKYTHAGQDREFMSSSIGHGNQFVEGEFQLVMHHELSKAIQQLGWA